MAQQRNALRAGLFMIATVGLVIAAIIAIAGFDRLFSRWQRCTAMFGLMDDVGGLRVGDEVRLGGVKVGYIHDIRIRQTSETTAATQPAVKTQIFVTFDLPEQYVLHANSVIRVQSLLTGTSHLNIEDLGSGAPLPAGAMLTGQPSAVSGISNALQQMAPTIQQIASEVQKTTVPRLNETLLAYKRTAEEASELVTQVKGKVDPALQRYNIVADRTAEAMTQIRDLVGDSKADVRASVGNIKDASASIKDASANIKAASDALREKMPALLAQAESILANLEKAAGKVNVTLDEIQIAVNNAKDLTASAKSIVVANKGKFNGMLAALKITADNLKNASAEIRRSPWRLLYKPKPDEIANLNLYDSARQFAEGAHDLSDAAIALRDALDDPQADKARLQQILDRVDKSFMGFNEVEQKLWKAVKE